MAEYRGEGRHDLRPEEKPGPERLAREAAFRISVLFGGSNEKEVAIIADAIRAALDEAATVARMRADELHAEAGKHFAARDFNVERMFMLAFSEARWIAAAIEALKGVSER